MGKQSSLSTLVRVDVPVVNSPSVRGGPPFLSLSISPCQGHRLFVDFFFGRGRGVSVESVALVASIMLKYKVEIPIHEQAEWALKDGESENDRRNRVLKVMMNLDTRERSLLLLSPHH